MLAVSVVPRHVLGSHPARISPLRGSCLPSPTVLLCYAKQDVTKATWPVSHGELLVEFVFKSIKPPHGQGSPHLSHATAAGLLSFRPTAKVAIFTWQLALVKTILRSPFDKFACGIFLVSKCQASHLWTWTQTTQTTFCRGLMLIPPWPKCVLVHLKGIRVIGEVLLPQTSVVQFGRPKADLSHVAESTLSILKP